jgi:hypothetical protein
MEERAEASRMLKHTNRGNRVHILTLDEHLAADVRARLAGRAEFAEAELVTPKGHRGGIALADVAALVRGTVSSRLLVLDVRSHTLPRLMDAYNKVVGYNRSDFNHLCYTVLIGDGPANLFAPGTGFEAFVPYLARFRVDFHAGAFFFDPFLHYTHAEKSAAGVDPARGLPDAVPPRLAEAFKEENLSVGQVRLYFRAAGVAAEKYQEKKAKRQRSLERFLRKRLAEAFGSEKPHFSGCFSKEGFRFEAEALELHVYPFFFEEWAGELYHQAQVAKL